MEFNTKGEYRCGFYVDEKRKKIWKIQLEMLEYLLKVCKDNNIKIFGIAGTMLGAVRHGGFIPWDDDIDMAMYRTDYNKFMKIIEENNPFKEPLFLQTQYNDPEHYSPSIRLRHSLSTAIIDYDKTKKCNNGIFIDIFPLDGYCQNKFKRKIQIFELRIMHKIMKNHIYPQNRTMVGKVKSIGCNFIIKLYPYNKMIKRYHEVASRYSTEDCEMIDHFVRPMLPSYNNRYLWRKKYIEDLIYVKFEDLKLPIPKEYDKCLKQNFGNYMVLPPIEERGLHHAEKIIFDPDTPFIEYQKKMGWIE